jgi:RND family efflux transporter MFP subunit
MSRVLTFSGLVLALAFAGLLASCGQEPSPKAAAPAAAEETRVLVKTVPVARAAWPSIYEATGTVRARTTAIISAKLMGYVNDVRAQVGDRVSEGQTLVVLDARDLETAVRRAEAARDEVRSAIPEADSAAAAAKAQADLAQVTFERMQDLFNKKSITNQEFDEASARLKSAKAAYEMARAKRTQLDAKLAQAEQEVRAAGINRSYAGIKAPFAGVVVTRSVEPGTLTVPGAPLFTLEREGAYRLEAAVEESRLGSIRVGQPVTVSLDGISRTLTARVSEIVPSVDPAARTGTVKIDLPALRDIRSGLFGRAKFELGTQSVLEVPAAAVKQHGQLQSVFVVENHVARARLVTLGARFKDHYEVLSGLAEGEPVIVPIPADLNDGSPVEVRQ